MKDQIDTLSVTENADGSFTVDWSPDDPKWSWMNDLSSSELQVIMEQAIKNHLDDQPNT